MIPVGAVLHAHAIRHRRSHGAPKEGPGHHSTCRAAGAVRGTAAVLRGVLCVPAGEGAAALLK